MKKETKEKKKIILNILMFSILILLSVDNVHASTSPYFKDITFPVTYKIYNLTSSNSRTEISSNKSCYSNEADVYDVCYITWDATFATYGYGINILTDNTFLTGNNYGVTYYFGSNSWVWYSNWYSGYSLQSYISGGWWENPANKIISEQRNDCIDLGSSTNEHIYGYRYLCSYNQVFEATNSGYYLWTVFNRSTTGPATEEDFAFLGYSISNQGASGLTVNEIKTALSDDFEALESSISSMKDTQEQTNEKLDEQIQQDKEQHDEFMDSDISEQDKTLPDDSKYQDYTSTEDSLKDKVNQADLSVLSIGIDAKSSSWVWNTLTSFIQSNSIIFGMFIAILSIGIIKLALGR